VDVFEAYGYLWTYCENYEKFIYKQYAQRNKYVAQKNEFTFEEFASAAIKLMAGLCH
jgi:hypothetical protein